VPLSLARQFAFDQSCPIARADREDSVIETATWIVTNASCIRGPDPIRTQLAARGSPTCVVSSMRESGTHDDRTFMCKYARVQKEHMIISRVIPNL
jgi:hypothetical protein